METKARSSPLNHYDDEVVGDGDGDGGGGGR